MYVFLLLMFEHPEHTKMTFRIKFNTVNMDNISYHDNKLETGKTNGRNKGTCNKLHNIGSTENSEFLFFVFCSKAKVSLNSTKRIFQEKRYGLLIFNPVMFTQSWNSQGYHFKTITLRVSIWSVHVHDCIYVAVTWKPKTKQKKCKMMKNKNVYFFKSVHLSMFRNCGMIILSQFSYV